MANMDNSQGWLCGNCRKMKSPQAWFCDSCGQPWEDCVQSTRRQASQPRQNYSDGSQHGGGVPWGNSGWTDPSIPGNGQRPRRRSRRKPKQAQQHQQAPVHGGQGQGYGTGKGSRWPRSRLWHGQRPRQAEGQNAGPCSLAASHGTTASCQLGPSKCPLDDSASSAAQSGPSYIRRIHCRADVEVDCFADATESGRRDARGSGPCSETQNPGQEAVHQGVALGHQGPWSSSPKFGRCSSMQEVLSWRGGEVFSMPRSSSGRTTRKCSKAKRKLAKSRLRCSKGSSGQSQGRLCSQTDGGHPRNFRWRERYGGRCLQGSLLEDIWVACST